jgi:hypothetical protein
LTKGLLAYYQIAYTMESIFTEKPKKKNILDEARDKFVTIFRPRRKRRRNVIIDGEIVPRLQGSSSGFDIILTLFALTLIVFSGLFYFVGLQPLILEKYTAKSSTQTQSFLNEFNKQAGDSLVKTQNTISSMGKFDPDGGNCGRATSIQPSMTTQIVVNESYNKLSKTVNLRNFEVENRYIESYNHYVDSTEAFNTVNKSFSQIGQFQTYQKSWIESCDLINKSAGTLKDLKVICQNLSLQQKNWDKISQSSAWATLTDQVKDGIGWCAKVTAFQSESVSTTQSVRNGNQVVTTPDTTTPPTDTPLYPEFKSWLIDFLPSYQSVMRFVPDYTSEYNTLKTISNDLQTEVRNTISYNEKYISSKDSFERKFYLMDL